MNKIIKKVLIVFISLLALTGCFENNDNNYRLNEKYEIVTTSNGWIYDYAFLKFEEDKLTTVYKASSEEIPHSTETYTFTREGNNLEFMLESVVGEIKVTITLTSDTTLTITFGEYTQNYQKTDKEIPNLNFPNGKYELDTLTGEPIFEYFFMEVSDTYIMRIYKLSESGSTHSVESYTYIVEEDIIKLYDIETGELFTTFTITIHPSDSFSLDEDGVSGLFKKTTKQIPSGE